MTPSLITTAILALGGVSPCFQAPVSTTGRAYKVAFWYDVDQPVKTLQFRAYDVAKGEYDEKAVDGWFRNIFDHDPKHGAYSRYQHRGADRGDRGDRGGSIELGDRNRKKALGRASAATVEADTEPPRSFDGSK